MGSCGRQDKTDSKTTESDDESDAKSPAAEAAQCGAPGWLAGDLACLDAGGADVQALGRARHDSANGLDVGVPAAAGAAVRVRDVVAEARPLAAYVADGS